MAELKHKTKDSVDFLKKWCPEGPWVLTAIIPDGKTETVSFQPSAWQKAADWIERPPGQA